MDIDFFSTVDRVKVPILFILGSADPWIPVEDTVKHLHELQATHPLLQYAVVPNANHLMMTPPVPEKMDDADPKNVSAERPQSTAYFALLASWLTKVCLKG